MRAIVIVASSSTLDISSEAHQKRLWLETKIKFHDFENLFDDSSQEDENVNNSVDEIWLACSQMQDSNELNR